MPWIDPSNDNDMTDAEFNSYLDANEEDLENLPKHHVWVPAHSLFEHSDSEIEAMDDRDKKNGSFIGSSFIFGRKKK